MTDAIRYGRSIAFLVVILAGLSCSAFFACGGNEEADTMAAEDGNTQTEEVAAPASDAASMVPAGWQTMQFQGWFVSFPADWNGNSDAGLWWPGEGSMNMGSPPVSVHCGGTPYMPNSNFEEKVLSHINAEPRDRSDVTVAGFSGFTCTWESMGKTYMGLFLEEKSSGGVGIVHFVNCRAPKQEFEQYRADFEKILASVRK